MFFAAFLLSDVGKETARPSPLIPHHYSSREGLIFDNVNSIVQDRTGFIWIATEDGLNRFDGKSFHNSRLPEGLAGNYIAQLHIDSWGHLGVTSRNGISRYDASSESFIHHELVSNRGSRFKTDVSSVSRSANHQELWVSSNGLGFYRFNVVSGQTSCNKIQTIDAAFILNTQKHDQKRHCHSLSPASR